MRIPHGLRAALASQGAAPPAPSSDANFENVSLLLHGDGTNGAQNNTFTDGSPNNFTITRTGNTTQGTFSPFSPTGWSAFFDGTGDNLTTAASNENNLGTSDFTIEFWINSAKTTRSDPFGWNYSFSNAGWAGFIFNLSSSGDMAWYEQTSSRISASATGWNNGAWNHVALTRSGNSVRMFLNGTQVGSTYTTSFSYGANTSGFIVGDINGGGGAVNGYISNLRVVKGTAVYTSNFTPPTSPLTAITNTSLLTLQDNRFKDNSTNNFAITRFGDTRIEAFSPFNPTAAYSASTHGGSGYFDGSGDRIYCTPSNLTGQFTIEGWWYANAFQSTPVFCGNWSVGCLLRYSGAQIQWYMPGGSGAAAYTLTTGQWYHMAVTRDSSNVVRVFANGVQLFSLTNSASITMTNYCIGSESTASNTTDIWNGYISGFRILNGTCLYNSAFTPPTSPPTAIANTNLLVNFTNGGIIDNASKNVLETVGNAQISTSVKKFGTGSMYFDGTGDYAIGPANTNLNFGTGDFTVELWANIISSNDFGTLFNTEVYAQQSQLNTFDLRINSSRQVSAGTYGTGLVVSSAISANTWTHIAVTRQGTSFRLFIDGTLSGTATNSTNFVAGGFTIGALPRSVSNTQINGYIDDLRITRGVARYTANFTPPTAAFPDL